MSAFLFFLGCVAYLKMLGQPAEMLYFEKLAAGVVRRRSGIFFPFLRYSALLSRKGRKDSELNFSRTF